MKNSIRASVLLPAMPFTRGLPPHRSRFQDGGHAPDTAVAHVLRGVGEFRGSVARRLLPGFELGNGRAVFADDDETDGWLFNAPGVVHRYI